MGVSDPSKNKSPVKTALCARRRVGGEPEIAKCYSMRQRPERGRLQGGATNSLRGGVKKRYDEGKGTGPRRSYCSGWSRCMREEGGIRWEARGHDSDDRPRKDAQSRF